MKKTLVILPALLLAACQPTLTAEFQDRPVVTCYLYAGEPVRVTVAKLLPFRDDVRFSGEDVNQLALAITDETTGSVYALTPQGAGGVYTGGAFLPEAGHAYRLQFTYDGLPVTAATQVAPLPEQVAFSTHSISAGFGGGGGGGMPEPLKITWDNPAGAYFVVTGVCIETSPTPVYDVEDDDVSFDFPLSFQTEPAQDTIVRLSSQSFSYRGRYAMKLCAVQPEYVLMYRLNSVSTNLLELHANVENGFGIFTGVGSVSDTVTVYAN